MSLAKYGVAFLLWGLLDHVVDTHFEVVQKLDEKIEQLEDMLFGEGKRRDQYIQRHSYDFRKNLAQVRRIVLPMREVVNALFRRDLHVVEPAMQPYYQDVYDHVLRASEWTDSMRDLVSTIFETHLSLQDNRLNEIMKKLTAYAAIIAVPTAVTGFYGENVPYPGFGRHWGFMMSVTTIIIIAGLLFYTFRRKDWL
jgi:magnesium transporter